MPRLMDVVQNALSAISAAQKADVEEFVSGVTRTVQTNYHGLQGDHRNVQPVFQFCVY